jgi:hypothetical protein
LSKLPNLCCLFCHLLFLLSSFGGLLQGALGRLFIAWFAASFSGTEKVIKVAWLTCLQGADLGAEFRPLWLWDGCAISSDKSRVIDFDL